MCSHHWLIVCVCVTNNGWVEVDDMCEILQSLIWFIGCFSQVLSVWSIQDNSIDDIDEKYKSFIVGGVAIGCSLVYIIIYSH